MSRPRSAAGAAWRRWSCGHSTRPAFPSTMWRSTSLPSTTCSSRSPAGPAESDGSETQSRRSGGGGGMTTRRAHCAGRRGRESAGPEEAFSRVAASHLRDVAVMTRRNLVHIAREPMQLSDVTVQPVLFTVLFVYVFGSGMIAAQARQLHQFRHCRPAFDEPSHLLHGDWHWPRHRYFHWDDRAFPDSSHVACVGARRPHCL